jgi:hypothetical protein
MNCGVIFGQRGDGMSADKTRSGTETKFGPLISACFLLPARPPSGELCCASWVYSSLGWGSFFGSC